MLCQLTKIVDNKELRFQVAHVMELVDIRDSVRVAILETV